MKCLAVRSKESLPSTSESYVSVKKIRTKKKEKEQLWLWNRPSRTSSISTVSSPASSPPSRHESQHHRVHSKRKVCESARSEDVQEGANSHHHRRRRRHHDERQTSEHHTHFHHHHYHHILPVHSSPSKHQRALPASSPSPKNNRRNPAAILVPEEKLQELPVPPKKSGRSSRNMDEIDIFTYKRERACVATESVAPSTASASMASVASSNADNTYRYIAMREPGPHDAVPIAYGYAPFYAFHQPPVAVAAPKSVKSVKSAKSASVPPCHCDDESANYITDKVVEKSAKSVVRAASPPPPSEPKMPYAIYPAAAHPIAYAMPNYPIPVHPTKEKPKEQDKDDGKRIWVGRTKKQVDEDNAKIANKEGVYKPNEIMPKGAAPDQLFWVIEQDGTNTLRTFRTIEEDLQPGKWKIDPRYGNAYFVRRDKE